MIVGIDLGTTNSLIGAMDAGFPVLFANDSGARLTPSIVAADADGRILVGREAAGFDGAMASIKRSIGTGRSVMLGGESRSPEQVSAAILGELKRIAERATGGGVREAVITVPAYFNDAQRAATKRAGELAGFEVRRLLAEPTAAALAYGLDKLGERSKVAVFDLGGGTFDISILELAEGVFHVLATHGDTRLGGDDFDAAIAERLGISREAAKAAKEEHSKFENRQSKIDDVCLPILERTRAHCLRALADANLEAAALDEVILVGGATRMPLVRRFVNEVFGREPNTSQHPDEAVALGAVLQAGILEGSVRDVTLLDVTPLSLGIETFGGLMNVLIPRNTTIPVKKGEMFTNAVANQREMRIAVLQGERELAQDNWKLGEFDLAFTPAPKGQARVGVQFEIDANGILNVLARDIATGRDTVVEIRSAVDVADDAVETMIADSVEHAFEDMTGRQLAEAKLKAEEMLPAIDAAYAQLGARLSADERARIDALAADVRAAMVEGNLQRLKKLLAELDDATQDLAILLLESLSGEDRGVDACDSAGSGERNAR